MALAGVAVLAGCAGNDPVAATQAALESVPDSADGRSTIEDRYVYADPDEGWIEIPLTPGFTIPNEFSIEDLHGEARVRIHYSRRRGTVDVYADFENGALPYRPTYEKRFDDSTEFNPQMVRVEDARWQMWIIGALAGRHQEMAYYDLATQRFLGTRFDFQPLGSRPAPVEGTYFTVPFQITRMICSPIFEGNEQGEGHFHWRYDFHRMADAAGTPGTIQMIAPFDFCHPDYVSNYWTQERLPDEMYMSFDLFLQSIADGESIGIAVSAEPYPKPPSLAYRDNTFIGWGNTYPQIMPPGWTVNVRSGGALERVSGRNEQNDPWPASILDLCGGAP